VGSAAAVKGLRHDLLNLSLAVLCDGAANGSRAAGPTFIALEYPRGILLVNSIESQRRGFSATIAKAQSEQGRPEFGTAGRD